MVKNKSLYIKVIFKIYHRKQSKIFLYCQTNNYFRKY